MIFRLLIFSLLALATGCNQKLSIRSEYLTEASLASYHVGTPDEREAPLVGQQLIISWRIPSALWHKQELKLDFTIRFRNNEEKHQIVVVCKRPIGTYVYRLEDEEFLRVGGILTYKVSLLEEGEISESWFHPLWQERITFQN